MRGETSIRLLLTGGIGATVGLQRKSLLMLFSEYQLPQSQSSSYDVTSYSCMAHCTVTDHNRLGVAGPVLVLDLHCNALEHMTPMGVRDSTFPHLTT